MEVQPGWLDALVATSDAYPGAGAIGSRMTFTDGTLHEAGQIVWRDGWPFAGTPSESLQAAPVT